MPGGRRLRYLLSGNARCGECGGSLIVVSAAVLQAIAKAETEQQRLVNALAAGGSGASALVAALQKGRNVSTL
jgi:hypothetical protein